MVRSRKGLPRRLSARAAWTSSVAELSWVSGPRSENRVVGIDGLDKGWPVGWGMGQWGQQRRSRAALRQSVGGIQ